MLQILALIVVVATALDLAASIGAALGGSTTQYRANPYVKALALLTSIAALAVCVGVAF